MSRRCTTCCSAIKRNGTECPKCQSRRWRAANPLRATFLHLKRSASRYRHGFNLTLEQFAQWCAETGYLHRKGRSEYHCDRIDPDRGYEIGNIRVLEASENSRQRRPARYVVLGRVKTGTVWKPEPYDPLDF